jgi:transcriptional regulator with XRE-family HTH domain
MVNEANNTEKVFNARLETLRVKKELSQETLGQNADIEKSYFSRLLGSAEKRRKNPDAPDAKRWNIDHIDRLAKALGVPVWQLFVDPREVIPPEYLELMESYRHLDAGRKQAVDDIFAAARADQKKKSQSEQPPSDGPTTLHQTPLTGR